MVIVIVTVISTVKRERDEEPRRRKNRAQRGSTHAGSRVWASGWAGVGGRRVEREDRTERTGWCDGREGVQQDFIMRGARDSRAVNRPCVVFAALCRLFRGNGLCGGDVSLPSPAIVQREMRDSQGETSATGHYNPRR